MWKGWDLESQFEFRYFPSEVHILESIESLRYSLTAFMSLRVDLFSDSLNSCIVEISFLQRGVGFQSPSISRESFVLDRKRIRDWTQGAYT